jgi:hypothetical protein
VCGAPFVASRLLDIHVLSLRSDRCPPGEPAAARISKNDPRSTRRGPVGSGSGVGLRGGTFSTDYGDFTIWTTTLTGCLFAQDVAVSGTVTWRLFAASGLPAGRGH